MRLDNDIDDSYHCIGELLIENANLYTTSIEVLCDDYCSYATFADAHVMSEFSKGFLLGEQLMDNVVFRSHDNTRDSNSYMNSSYET